MSANLYDLEHVIANFMKTGDNAPKTPAPAQPEDRQQTAQAADAHGGAPTVSDNRSETELYELLALMHVPTREIIDLDERNAYENYLAAHRNSP